MGVAPRPIYGVTAGSGSFHQRYLALAAEIERQFDVAKWRSGDVDIWPMAKMDLYLDMYWQSIGQAPPEHFAFPLRVASRTLRPLSDFWRNRRDLSRWVFRPKPAHAIFLGDGVSLDLEDGAWADRFGEPIMASLERRGLTTFLMQSGNLRRPPWRRPTFAANLIEGRGWLASWTMATPATLPDHERVIRYLSRRGVSAPSLACEMLVRRAHVVSATASAFEKILKVVQPKLAFVVAYYAHLGHAFALACRRRGVLCVDLQHNPQEGAHKAYAWSAVPERGYRTLPAAFWSWTEEDAANIRRWATLPWHVAIHGGHTQLPPFLDDSDPKTKAWDQQYCSSSAGQTFEREVLVALQPIAGHRAKWDGLADQIEASPRAWRWWIRRHPASNPKQDAEFGRLLSLRGPNVAIEEASSIPLPALLRHVSAVVSLASGAASEAAMFGVPALFLSDEAAAMFPDLFSSGRASIIDARDTNMRIANLSLDQRPASRQPDLNAILARLEEVAQNYSALCRIEVSQRAVIVATCAAG
jgi:hypothetical protein